MKFTPRKSFISILVVFNVLGGRWKWRTWKCRTWNCRTWKCRTWNSKTWQISLYCCFYQSQ